MNIEDSLQQVRQAHRICAGFYQQVLPRIERVQELMDIRFLQWNSISFESSPSKSVSPFKCWKWDFLPLMDTSFTFIKKSESRYFCPNDYILDIRLITDSELEWKHRENVYSEQEPDACKLNDTVEQSESYLAIYLFSPTKQMQNNNVFDRLWHNSDYPGLESEVALSNQGLVKTIGFKFLLADFVQEGGPEKLIEEIKQHLSLMDIKE
ncbi:hypothetical protein [Pectobacterium carotovorum]|uniref:Uncharacterized protein n=1 Tax=Pectobacterium carotovorum subsp. carotovorum TaxID=555 RepID=A0AAI9L1G1_PECCC|nr:hypothetical protein [Pectobacterium carotovorum]MBA0180110.1 hypothetical protein [Pectobacterium carotovorum]GKX47583.1 hypothetical protein SOASR016_23350 [Pectobacterium carotovorum subsp. carotovorum]GLV70027.1 hypothetical protein Pcaca03_24710 [Pectobacterium carotovorum subsp. carotovorum]